MEHHSGRRWPAPFSMTCGTVRRRSSRASSSNGAPRPAISCLRLHLPDVSSPFPVLRTWRRTEVSSLAEPGSRRGRHHAALLRSASRRLTPQIVSSMSSGFDLHVLHYHGMLHGVAARRFIRSRRRRFALHSREFPVERLHHPLPHATPRPDRPARPLQRRANAPLDDLARALRLYSCGHEQRQDSRRPGRPADRRSRPVKPMPLITYLVYNRFHRPARRTGCSGQGRRGPFVKARVRPGSARPHWRVSRCLELAARLRTVWFAVFLNYTLAEGCRCRLIRFLRRIPSPTISTCVLGSRGTSQAHPVQVDEESSTISSIRFSCPPRCTLRATTAVSAHHRW